MPVEVAQAITLRSQVLGVVVSGAEELARTTALAAQALMDLAVAVAAPGRVLEALAGVAASSSLCRTSRCWAAARLMPQAHRLERRMPTRSALLSAPHLVLRLPLHPLQALDNRSSARRVPLPVLRQPLPQDPPQVASQAVLALRPDLQQFRLRADRAQPGLDPLQAVPLWRPPEGPQRRAADHPQG